MKLHYQLVCEPRRSYCKTFQTSSLALLGTKTKSSTSHLFLEQFSQTPTKLEPYYDQYYNPDVECQLYNNSVATSMYNTRRAAYMNSCSTAMELPPQSMHQNWQDTEYVNANCSSDIDGTDMPTYNNEKEDEPYYQDGKKPSRKRANTTSSNGGNEKESKRTANKICRVCGDKAFSYNFNVITCESCKAFFRRNANKEKEIRCPFNEQCEINMVSRRFCQRCRLAKCFTVGMKKEWIMSEEARLEKKQRVEENRERRLQDALNRAIEEANMDDESENSYDEAPPTHQMSVRQYLTGTEDNVNNKPQPPQPPSAIPQPQPTEDHARHFPFNRKDEKIMNYYVDSPAEQEHGYPINEFDYTTSLGANSTVISTAASLVENQAHSVITTIANAVASTANLPSTIKMNSERIPSSAFLPPALPSIQDVAAIISQGETTSLGIHPGDVVDGSLMSAVQVQAAAVQVQAAAAQAQAVINQTQQLAAAVVAQQVVSQMAPVLPTVAPLDPLLAPALIAATPSLAPITAPINPAIATAISSSMTAPLTTAPLAIPIIAKELPCNVSLLNQLEHTASDMVTVPKNMLMKLIQSSSRTACSCTCLCGRYPPGSTIVDEVTRDLVHGGSSNNSSVAPTERDEARLETTEDMQMNGLLPGESNSSIHWLSQQSSAQAVIDPICHTVSAEEEHNRERRDSVFGAYTSTDMMSVAPISVQEETFWEHTVAENESRELSEEEVEKMEELTEISNCWTSSGLDSVPILELFTDKNIEAIVNNLKLLSSFRFLQKCDKRKVVKQGLFAYCVVKWMQHQESMSLDGLPDNVRKDFIQLLKKEEYHYRIQPGAFNALAISALFHSDSDCLISTEVYMEHLVFKKLLDKTLPIKVSSDDVYNSYFPVISVAAKHLEKITDGIPDRVIRYSVS